MNKLRFIAVGLVALAFAAGPATADVVKSKNVELVASFEYKGALGKEDYFSGGTDIDFSGKYIYAMQQGMSGGVHVYDASGKTPKEVSFIPCPGEQNDVAVVKPGLIALGYHSSTCAGAPGGGIRLIDVTNPKRPKYLGAVTFAGGTHTLTVYPGKEIIYSSPDGLGNVRGIEQIIDVSDPRKPEVVATYNNAPNACHDLTFSFFKDQKLAFCPGSDQTEIWDVTDPLAPSTIGRIVNPLTFYAHSAYATFDNKYLVVGDENTEADECVGGKSGALMIYDIATPAVPVLVGSYGIDRGQEQASVGSDRETYCTAHNGGFVPKSYNLVMSWYAAGFNVLDLTDPSEPKETAFYMGTGDDDYANYWSAYYYDGLIYANDRTRGLDVFKVTGL